MLTMKYFVILFIVIAVVDSMTILEDIVQQWNDFKAKHNKTYATEVEEARRFVIFLENVQKINNHNEIHGKKYKLKVNKYADLHHEEFVNLMNGYNKTFSPPVRKTNYVPFKISHLPAQFDWRKEGAVTEVKDQGNCGSCWAFSTTGALEGQRHRVFGKLVSLSEQNLIDCSRRNGNEGCDGGLMDFAYQYIIDNRGIATEKSYPYFSQTRYCKYKKEDFGASITGYIDLPPGDELVLQHAVALNGPISVAIDASHISFQFYNHGIYDEPNCSNVTLDHGVLVVGYGTKHNVDYWIVKNSWGKDWGVNGYIYMRRNKYNNCGIATKASYPII